MERGVGEVVSTWHVVQRKFRRHWGPLTCFVMMFFVMLVLALRYVFKQEKHRLILRSALGMCFMMMTMVMCMSVKLAFEDMEDVDEEQDSRAASEQASQPRQVPDAGAQGQSTQTGLGRGSRRTQRRIINQFLSTATQATIDRLPLYVYQNKEKEASEDEEAGEVQPKMECTICLENVDQGDKIRILPCLHQFHSDCVDQWLLNHAKCPTCKYSIL